MFRPDLLFRLNTIVLRVPPLRARRDDIAMLLRHYLAHYESQYQRHARAPAAEALDYLQQHDWPGNVRALRHACERAVILGGEAHYTRDDFGLFDSAGQAAAAPAAPAHARQTLGALERDAIHRTLEQVDGNISHAAKALGISRAALYRKLNKHGI